MRNGLKPAIRPGEILYDAIKDKLVVYSGHVVKDEFGQDAAFCLDRENRKNARVIDGCIYTGWVLKKAIEEGKIIRTGADA